MKVRSIRCLFIFPKKIEQKRKKKFLVVSNDLLFCCSPEKHKAAINQWTTAYHHWVVLICRIFFSLVGVAFNTGATTKDRQREKKKFFTTQKRKNITHHPMVLSFSDEYNKWILWTLNNKKKDHNNSWESITWYTFILAPILLKMDWLFFCLHFNFVTCWY